MRAFLCYCHHHLEAEDDDALCAVVREHLLGKHPAMEPSEEQAQQIVSSRAFDLYNADVEAEEEFGPW
jgi:hypothetical protein